MGGGAGVWSDSPWNFLPDVKVALESFSIANKQPPKRSIQFINVCLQEDYLKSIYYPSTQSCQFQACHANPSKWSASHESNKHVCISLEPWD